LFEPGRRPKVETRLVSGGQVLDRRPGGGVDQFGDDVAVTEAVVGLETQQAAEAVAG
jgi:hypothetical protein